MRIYVGNLAFEVGDEDLIGAFGQHGQVASAQVVIDRFSNRSRGFGFVEMSDSAQAKAAIEALNGKEIKGRAIVVNEARARTESGGSRGGSSFGGGNRDSRGGGSSSGGSGRRW